MFRPEFKHYLKYNKLTKIISVRANKKNLQYCLFDIDRKTGGYKILNEGHYPIGNVVHFQLSELIDTDYIPRKEVVVKLEGLKYNEKDPSAKFMAICRAEVNARIDQLINSLKGE